MDFPTAGTWADRKTEHMKLSEFVAKDAIVADLKSRDRDGVITELVDALVACKAVAKTHRDTMIASILEREKRGSTGFGKGVAVPHVKHEKIRKMTATIGVSQHGVDFNALDKAPVYCVVLLLSPLDKPDEHLQAMETIFSYLTKDQFRRFLQQSSTAEQVVDLLNEADTQQLPG